MLTGGYESTNMSERFKAEIIPLQAEKLLIGTSRAEIIQSAGVKSVVHSNRVNHRVPYRCCA